MKYCMHCMNPLKGTKKTCDFCGKSLSKEIQGHHLIPGTKLNNRYIIGVSIGEGGFGITYIGRDQRVNKRIAIKEFYPSGVANRTNTISAMVSCSNSRNKRDIFEKGKTKFLTEAKTLGELSQNPGIVQVTDFFEENGTAYIVMEYLEGKTLKDIIKEKVNLTIDETVKYLLPVMVTLEKVHNRGLIHRDISPDNIMVMGEQVKLLDFGLAREFSLEDEKSFTTSLKQGYAPIEQYQEKGKQGPWTDVYAMCATIYTCITGKIPDSAPDRSEGIKLIMPSDVKIDANTENAIMKGLSLKPSDRFQSMKELIVALNVEDKSTDIVPVVESNDSGNDIDIIPLEDKIITEKVEKQENQKLEDEIVTEKVEKQENQKSEDEIVTKKAEENQKSEDEIVTEIVDEQEKKALKGENAKDEINGQSKKEELNVKNKDNKKIFLIMSFAIIVLLIVIIIILLLKSCSNRKDINESHIETTVDSLLETTKNESETTKSEQSNLENDFETTEKENENDDKETTVSDDETKESEIEETTQAQWSTWTDTLPEYVSAENYEIQEKKFYSTRLREIASSTEKNTMDGWELLDTVEANGGFGPWSNWSATKVEASADREVETQPHYSYRNKETSTDTINTKSGWTLYDTTYTWGNYGAWSNWSTNEALSSTSRKVETKEQYRYRKKETSTGTTNTKSGWALYDTTYTWGAFGAWSNWDIDEVSGSTSRKVESKVQYRFRDKETTTGTTNHLSGWTLYDTTYAWSDYGAWTDWTLDVLYNSDSRKVESKTQYTYRDITYSTVYTDWGPWSDWSLEAQATSDLKKEETRTVWEYYYYACPSCGAHMHGYNVCYTWAGGCGAHIPSSAWVIIQSEISWDAAGLQDWHGTGKYYTYINGQRVFKYTDGPAGGIKTQYRYAERSTQQVANYGNWSEWSDIAYSSSANREIQTRVVYRCCDRVNVPTYYFYRWGNWSDWTDTAYSANANREVATRTVYRYCDRPKIATYHFYRWGSWSSWADTAYTANTNTQVQMRTVYRYCDRSKIATYHFYKWGNWSSWSVNKVMANDNRQVKETMFYRYRDQVKKTTYYFSRWTAWSDYSEHEEVSSENVEVKTKMRYRYRTK